MPILPVIGRRVGRSATACVVLLAACTASTPAPAPSPVGTWVPLAEGPAARVGHVATWTGSQMLVWGGQEVEGAGYRGDGAAYDPSADTWDPIPEAPLRPRGRAVGVWTGTELLVWGGEVEGEDIKARSFADGAAFSPASGRWRALSPSPLGPRGLSVAVWTGSSTVIWGGQNLGAKPPAPTATPAGEEEGGNLQNQGASYDPATDMWTRIARSPLRGRARPRAVWTGHEVLVWGGGSTIEDEVAFVDGAAYDPAQDTWRSIGAAPIPAGGRQEAVWTGRQMLVWGGSGDAAAYDPASDRWTPVPKAPLPPLPTPLVVWTGRHMLVWGIPESQAQSERPVGAGAVYDPTSKRWLPLSHTGGPAGQGQTAVWTGHEMLVWGGLGGAGVPTAGGSLNLEDRDG